MQIHLQTQSHANLPTTFLHHCYTSFSSWMGKPYCEGGNKVANSYFAAGFSHVHYYFFITSFTAISIIIIIIILIYYLFHTYNFLRVTLLLLLLVILPLQILQALQFHYQMLFCSWKLILMIIIIIKPWLLRGQKKSLNIVVEKKRQGYVTSGGIKKDILVIPTKGINIKKIIERNQMTRVQEPKRCAYFCRMETKRNKRKKKVLKIQNTFDA